ncbi:hypothetical protein [Streptomyces griseiscabiei]|uniref:Uncharacterized protein n=1 Tax=Streptomyces griseiscabiei TaxID=2993540 RepID=A0ABU4L8M8_9ACTN|nr:hypothetical protein [Streptomyces griseiscabiei]MDX2911499.1 hypothetical protein [Streptomyces griseiscabiei]
MRLGDLADQEWIIRADNHPVADVLRRSSRLALTSRRSDVRLLPLASDVPAPRRWPASCARWQRFIAPDLHRTQIGAVRRG